MKQLNIILLIVLLASCTVQKRRYQKGFYVHHHKQTKQTVVDNKKNKVIEPVIALNTGDATDKLAAGTDNNLVLRKTKSIPLIYQADTCDRLVFKDGSEIQAKVLEVNVSEIKYRRCESLDGPIYATKKSDLFMISYADGRKEVMPLAEEPVRNTTIGASRPNTAPVRRSTALPENHATYSMVAGLISVIALITTPFIASFASIAFLASIVCAIVALSLAKRARRSFNNDPGMYTGQSQASVGTVLGIVSLSVVAISILIFLIVLAALLLLI